MFQREFSNGLGVKICDEPRNGMDSFYRSVCGPSRISGTVDAGAHLANTGCRVAFELFTVAHQSEIEPLEARPKASELDNLQLTIYSDSDISISDYEKGRSG
jgi:hypothetical protein